MIARDKDNYTDLYKKAIEMLESKGYENIQADLEGYPKPKGYRRSSDNTETVPDIVAEKNGKRYFFDLALKSEKPYRLKTKILFLKQLAAIKNYGFKLMTAHGHMRFSRDLTANTGLSPSAFMRI